MIWTLALLLVVAGILVPLIQRDLKRRAARREFARRMATLRFDYDAFSRSIAVKLIPIVSDFAREMAKVSKAAANLSESLRAFQEQMRPDGDES